MLGLAVAAVVVGCSHAAVTAPTTTLATTTTSTTAPAVSSLTIVGVQPGSCATGSGPTCVLRGPFFPQATVTQVMCGASPKGGRFVRVDLPAGGPGTPARTVMTKPTAVIVFPGGAVLVEPQLVSRPLYAEAMKSITTSTQGAFVLTLQNDISTGADGLTVVVGNIQIYGDYQCPATDVAYPGT